MAEESKENQVAVYGENVFDPPLFKGRAKCVAIYDSKGHPKILHCRMSDTVWGITTNADSDFEDWCKRFDVRDI